MKANSLHLAITALLSGTARTVAQNATVSHALTQWQAGQKTPVYQTLLALDVVESGAVTADKPKGPADRTLSGAYMQRGAVPASKGLTLERLQAMACPVASLPALSTLTALIASVETGTAPADAAEAFAELHKVTKAEFKVKRKEETAANRTPEQATKHLQKIAIAQAVKDAGAIDAAIALVADHVKAGTLSAVQLAALNLAVTAEVAELQS